MCGVSRRLSNFTSRVGRSAPPEGHVHSRTPEKRKRKRKRGVSSCVKGGELSACTHSQKIRIGIRKENPGLLNLSDPGKAIQEQSCNKKNPSWVLYPYYPLSGKNNTAKTQISFFTKKKTPLVCQILFVYNLPGLVMWVTRCFSGICFN